MLRNYIVETIGIIELIFLLPLVVFGALYNYLASRAWGGGHIDIDAEGLGKRAYLLCAAFWLIVAGYFVYQRQFTYLTYVYACPTSEVSKCYLVRADYVPPSCAGGYCDPSYIERIYFNNGGYIDFEYCEEKEKHAIGEWLCYAEKREDGSWSIEFSERMRVKKTSQALD